MLTSQKGKKNYHLIGITNYYFMFMFTFHPCSLKTSVIQIFLFSKLISEVLIHILSFLK